MHFSLNRKTDDHYMIEVCRIMSSMDRVNTKQLFPLVEGSRRRGHSFRVRNKIFRGDLRKENSL